MELPGTYHDLSPERKRFNAPRLLRDVEGDFVIQVRVSASFRPSIKSNVDDEDSRVAAGLVLIPADKNYIRLEYEGYRLNKEREQKEKEERSRKEMPPLKEERPRKEEQRRKEELHSGPAFMTMGKGILKMGLEPPGKQDRRGNEEQIYLRFERQGDSICEAISPDGKTWEALVRLTGPQNPPQKPKSDPCVRTAMSIQSDNFPRKIKVGLAAYSTSTEPFKVRFDQIKLARGKKKE
jgi:regulation of enolase protein 1 (concanavalin A-like superfamily)